MASFSLKRKKKKGKLAVSSSFFGDEGESAASASAASKIAVTERMEAQGKKAQANAEEEYKKVLEEDPSAFAFDEVYDTIKEKRDLAKGEKGGGEENKSKYIEQLMATTKQREFEYERATERQHQKEQKEEEAIHGKASEVFVTGAYKKRVEERRQWELEQARKAELEAKQDVRKRGNLNGFYSGMLQVMTKPLGAAEEKQEAVAAQEETQKEENLKRDTEQVESASSSRIKPSAAVVQVYKPGDMKRKREKEEKKEEAEAVKSKVSKTTIEEARRRAMERRRQREAKPSE